MKQSNQEEAWTGVENQDQDRPWVLEEAEAFEGGEVAFFLSVVATNRVEVFIIQGLRWAALAVEVVTSEAGTGFLLREEEGTRCLPRRRG